MPGPDTVLAGPPGWVVSAFQFAIGRPDSNAIESAQIRAAREAGFTGTREQLIAVGQGLRSREEFAAGQGGGPGDANRAGPRTPPISAVLPATPAFPTGPRLPNIPGLPGGPSIPDRIPGLPGSLPLPGVGGFLSRVLAPFIVGGLFWPTEAGRGSDLRDLYGVWNVAAPKVKGKRRSRRRARARARALPRPFALPGPIARPVVRPSSGPVTVAVPRSRALPPPMAIPSPLPPSRPVLSPPGAPSRVVERAPVPSVVRGPLVVSSSLPRSLPVPPRVPIPAPSFPLPSWLPLVLKFAAPMLFPAGATATRPVYRPGVITGPGLSPFGPGAVPVPALNPLTALQTSAVPFARVAPQTATDSCISRCAKAKKRKGKSKKREVCYAGTYIERSKGLSKTRKRKVKCT
jgi:hypothetical protein